MSDSYDHPSLTLVAAGAGTLGRALLFRLLLRPSRVIALCKPNQCQSLRHALVGFCDSSRAASALTPPPTFEVVECDVEQPGLGLASAFWERMKHESGGIHVIYGSADIRFDQTHDSLLRENVLGTENMLAFARELMTRGRLHRLDYISSAYVAGDRRGLVIETEPSDGEADRNDFEKSKRMAEARVEAERHDGLPVTIHRPSIVGADLDAQPKPPFRALCQALKVYARGQWRTIFGRADCVIDVVPAGFVADAILTLSSHAETIGRTFHLAAGPEGQATLGTLGALVERRFQGGRIRFVDPERYTKFLAPMLAPLFKLSRSDIPEKAKRMVPYLTRNPTFSTDEAQRFLHPHGNHPPRVVDYVDAILEHIERTNFGNPPAES